MISPALRALLTHSIDYAGLFPPAGLPLEPALANHARYVRSPEAWMLRAFVLPAAQLSSAASSVGRFDETHPLRVSVLGPRTETSSTFLAELHSAAAAATAFVDLHGDRVRIDQLEIVLPPDADASTLREARAMLDVPATSGARCFLEAPPAAAEGTMELLAADRAGHAGLSPFGFKLRTGGVVATAFPFTLQVAEVLARSSEFDIPIKFTAGLHHPIRAFHASVETQMHGFLNVFAAAVLTRRFGWDSTRAAGLVEETDPAAIRFEGDTLGWREWTITSNEIAADRARVCSFGSCSFDEPLDDLKGLGLEI